MSLFCFKKSHFNDVIKIKYLRHPRFESWGGGGTNPQFRHNSNMYFH